MDSHEVDRKIAEILGLRIVPVFVSETSITRREYEEGCLYEEPYRNRLYTHPGNAFNGSEEWSPSCNPADALAALEAWCRANGNSCSLSFAPPGLVDSKWWCSVDYDDGFYACSLCEAICNAILAAEAAHE